MIRLRIILDGQTQENMDLETAIKIVEEFLAKQQQENRIIKGCWLNGMEIEEDFLQTIKENLDSIAIVEFTSQSIADLINETTIVAKDYIEQLIPNIEKIADQIALDKEPKQELWLALIEGLAWLVDVYQGLLAQEEIFRQQGKTMLQQAEQLGDLMATIQQALMTQDTITIADLLEYELIDLLKNMQQVLTDYANFPGVKA